MSKIEIRKVSITKVGTDAIVNAANEGLWAGGGVCGAIFDAAGMVELTDPDRFDMSKWTGQNFLGFALMEVRKDLLCPRP